ncbi:hypothetical protein HPB52_013568 [Rhipicephalus sanguineus]|uniref:Uncharacterized protein n=1 Tax=Rhipicephalus sanguineus TaxID=34632 RepID=A0A9D4T3U7_RHISA|nr:hypothetical protein HPB52_013568 [Rhipicephalus sanguineus]
MLVDPQASTRRYTKQLKLAGSAVLWQKAVNYLGIYIEQRLTWIPAVKKATSKVRRVQGDAIRLHQAASTSVLLYALPLVTHTDQEEAVGGTGQRCNQKYPGAFKALTDRCNAGERPLSLKMLERALGRIRCLRRAPDGEALLTRLTVAVDRGPAFRSRPASTTPPPSGRPPVAW